MHAIENFQELYERRFGSLEQVEGCPYIPGLGCSRAVLRFQYDGIIEDMTIQSDGLSAELPYYGMEIVIIILGEMNNNKHNVKGEVVQKVWEPR